jgi:hypothetical protein
VYYAGDLRRKNTKLFFRRGLDDPNQHEIADKFRFLVKADFRRSGGWSPRNGRLVYATHGGFAPAARQRLTIDHLIHPFTISSMKDSVSRWA